VGEKKMSLCYFTTFSTFFCCVESLVTEAVDLDVTFRSL
jgi:hypothetical protein